MLLESLSYDEVQLKLLHRGSTYLYSGKKEIATFAIQAGVIVKCKLLHQFRTEEKRYGKAMMITSICQVCGSGFCEVMPPQKRGAKQT